LEFPERMLEEKICRDAQKDYMKELFHNQYPNTIMIKKVNLTAGRVLRNFFKFSTAEG